MASLIEACNTPEFPAEIVIVISNRANAEGIEHAAKVGIATKVIDHKDFDERERFEADITNEIEAAGAELVCLAGFMRLLTTDFVTHWRDRLINIHPSLLPSFKGLETHERALVAGVKVAGCTVHFVRAEMDTGPIIAQAAVPVKGSDTTKTLAARVLQAEHILYPHGLKLVASGRARVVGEKVVVEGEEPSGIPLFSPSPADI